MIHDEYNDTCSRLLNLPLLLRLSPFVLWKGLHLVGKWQLHWWGSIACLYHIRSWSCVAFEKIRFTDFYCNRSPYFRSSQEWPKLLSIYATGLDTKSQLSLGQDWRKYRRRKAHIMSSPRSDMPKLNSHKPCYDRIWQIPFLHPALMLIPFEVWLKQTQNFIFF